MTVLERAYLVDACSSCRGKLYPGFLKSGLTLKQMRVWSEAGFDGEEAVKWISAGVSPQNAVYWKDVLLEVDGFVDYEVVKRCVEISVDVGAYEEWKLWGDVFEKDAFKKLKGHFVSEETNATDVRAPETGFKKFGFSLIEAICLEEADFSGDDGDGGPSENYVGHWMSAGLSVNDLITLKIELDERFDEFEKKHESCREHLKNWNYELGPVISKGFDTLKSLGIPLNIENLLKYWGLSKSQILKAVDMGADIDFARDINFATNLVRNGIAPTKVKVVEYLISNGVEEETAIELTKRGFSIGAIEKIEKNGYFLTALIDAAQKLKPLKVDAVVNWLLVDIGSSKYAWLNRISEWHKFGFTPENAAEWYREEFSARDAKAWVESGAKTPAIAKRRKAAGISPKAVT